MKRLRGPDNGLPSSNNNSPEIVHQRSTSPQLTPADFSTIKHNNNNTPPLKEDKRKCVVQTERERGRKLRLSLTKLMIFR